MVQDTDTTMPVDLVPIEREVHFFDAVALGAPAELGLSPGRTAAEQDAVGRIHSEIIAQLRIFAVRKLTVAVQILSKFFSISRRVSRSITGRPCGQTVE